MRRQLAISIVVVALFAPVVATQEPSIRFAVLGDFGNGAREQYEVADRMWAARATFPFDLVLAVGDNMYGSQRPEDFVVKFERPYARLLQAGVRFQAALGNHDKPENRDYAPY